ncbi:MAG: hypothetical protein IKN08_01430 [Bacteroidales bacterium]|nr:hypothetical protein [Bacteroidales bacterium]
MKRVSILMAMAVWALGMASCGNQPSKEFKAMEEEVSSIEIKICEMTDCDELQMLNFAILGLRSDMDNYRQNSAMSEQEIELLDGKLDELMATWNGKWAALDCEQDMTDDELDTSGEEIGDYPE